MISISLRDENLIENVKAISTLKQSGLFSDEEIQKKYDEQTKRDESPKEEIE